MHTASLFFAGGSPTSSNFSTDICDCPEDSYSIFSFRLYPTEAFYREICRYGDYMEILAPSDVRAEMMDIIKGMQGEYDGLSRATCKTDNPLIAKLLNTK